MEDSIKPLVEELHELVRHGKLKEAKKFYWKNIHSLVEKRFIDSVNKKIESKKLPQYDWLIIPAGLEESYYVLLINALKPKKIYFLCTEIFRNEFLENIIKKTNLKREQYIVNVINYKGMDLAEVYGKIKEKAHLFNGKVAVDLTRGKRIISAGAAIMASFFGFDIIYIDEDWEVDIKRGVPGSEDLILVRNPFHIFGDLEKNYARIMFNQYNFNSSKVLLQELCKKVKDPREYEVLTLISETYDYWNAFNYNAASKKIQEALRKIDQFDLTIERETLKGNEEALIILSKINTVQKIDELLKDDNLILHLLIDLYTNALRRRESRRLDDAIVRLYRLLELISQYRLASYDIITSEPNYKNHPELKEKYKEITKQLYNQERELPFEIGIKDGHILLFLLEDEIWKNKTLEDMKKFLGPIRLRDNSIIAHGIETINDKAFKKIEEMSEEFLKITCKLLSKNLQELIQQHKFIKL